MAEERSTNTTLLDQMSSEVTAETSPLLQFLVKYARMIVIVLVACFAAAGGYGVYTWQAGKKVAEAQENLARVLIIRDDTARLAKLKEFAPTAPETMRRGVTLSIAHAAMQAKDYASAFTAWDELARDPKDDLYTTAMIGKAESLSLQDKSAEALAILEGMNVPADAEAYNLVNSLIVNIAEQAGNTAKAIEACEKLIAGMATRSPEEAEYWRQKASSLRLQVKAAS